MALGPPPPRADTDDLGVDAPPDEAAVITGTDSADGDIDAADRDDDSDHDGDDDGDDEVAVEEKLDPVAAMASSDPERSRS